MLSLAALSVPVIVRGQSPKETLKSEFRTSDRCVACHNGLKTSSGEDVSIGVQWRTSVMANSSRDPYWQGSVRRESIDHPQKQAEIENECSTCHMPLTHFSENAAGQKAQVFAHLPLSSHHQENAAAASDGVSCSMCHQITSARLGTPESYNGNVEIASPNDKNLRAEYGPFDIDSGHQQIMHSSTAGFIPQQGMHIRDSALCGSCHTLKTKTLGPQGQELGVFPEQVPYEEWLHSDYPNRSTCQQCHMPEVNEPVRIASTFGNPRSGMHRHEFIGGNFVLQNLLHDHGKELAAGAPQDEFAKAAARTEEFLKTKSARVSVNRLDPSPNGLDFEVLVENLTGHKLPTAYPSRRAWLHVTVKDAEGKTVFESGALNPDGSIVGNDNDFDAQRYEPYYRVITDREQVQIFEPILKDFKGHVTTGLLSAVGYFKDDRLLPSGFDKDTAEKDIAVVGDAALDPAFNGKGSITRYQVNTAGAQGPFHIDIELDYQPIGFRWAHNLEPYKAEEPQRLVKFYESESNRSAIVLAKAEASTAR